MSPLDDSQGRYLRRSSVRLHASRHGFSLFLERLASLVAGGARWLIMQKRRLGWKRFLLRGAGLAFLLGVAYLGVLWLSLPDTSDPSALLASQSTVITDRNDVELYRLYGEEDRTYVSADHIADDMEHAIVAIEDERFFQHGCIEPRSILRAVFARITGRSVTGGASTLTQQLARNALLTLDRTVTRKLREMMLACELERTNSKEKLLELYLNWIPFGQNAYGIEQASQRYFGTKATDLTLAQSAILAALPQLPSYYSPYGHHVRTTVTEGALKRIVAGQANKAADLKDDDILIGLLGGMVGTGSTKFYVGGRTDQVLKNMQDQGYIDEDQRTEALDELKIIAFKPSRENIRAPHFVLWVKEQVETLLGKNADKGLLEQGGLTIKTTLDWKLQQAAEAAIAAKAKDFESVYGARNIALVALDPKTREVLAYVGNSDYSKDEGEAKIDMARVPRQPGSSFKPFVYAAAFEQGYGPATPLYDVPTKFGEDQPQNFDGGFWGLLNARKSLGASRNIPAIKAFFLAGGEQPILDLTEQMGVPSPKKRKAELNASRPFDYGWPLAIGAAETPLTEMVDGYATLGDAGLAKPVVSIVRITDKRGSLISLPLPKPEDEGEQVLDPRIAYQVTSILSDASVRPNDFWKEILSIPGFQAAAKTGTSNKCLNRNEKDGLCTERKPDNLWTIGYTPNLVAGVWVGNANSEPLSDKADGLNVAAPVWKDFMVRAHKIIQVNATNFPVPEGIVQPQVSYLSGQLPTECTPVDLRRADVFLSERAPTKADPACQTLTVDKVTGLLASDSCPKEAEEERSFFLPQSELPDRWPGWAQAVQEWARRATTGSGGSLPLPLAPAESCDITKTPGRLIKPVVQILSPANGETVTYPAFHPKIQVSVGSTASGVTFLVDDKVVARASGSAAFKTAIRVPRSVSKDGIHRLEVILTDEYFNTATASVTFRFSDSAVSSGPSVRFSSPAPGSTFASGSGVTLSANAFADVGIKYVEFYLDRALLTRKPREPFGLTYPLTDITPGRHTLRAVITDLNGKTDQDEVEIEVME
jgi:membrane peptidoglycan carboxypeptidase